MSENFYRLQQLTELKVPLTSSNSRVSMKPFYKSDQEYLVLLKENSKQEETQKIYSLISLQVTDVQNELNPTIFKSKMIAKPLFYNGRSMIFRQNKEVKLVIVNMETNEQKELNIDCKISWAYPIKEFDSVFLIAKTKESYIYQFETNSLQRITSFSRILQPYSMITHFSFTETPSILHIGTYLPQFNQFHILTVILQQQKSQGQERSKMEFILTDTYKLKQNTKLDCIVSHDEGSLYLGYNASRITKITININKNDINTFRRQFRKIKHNLNFFKIKNLIPLNNEKDILVQDQYFKLAIFEQFKKLPQLRQTIDKFDLSNLNASILNIVSFDDRIWVFEHSGKDRLSIYGVIQTDFQSQLQHFLFEKDDILTSTRMIRFYGKGRELYLQYQLRKEGFKDLNLLKEYLSQKFISINTILELIKNMQHLTIDALEIILIKLIEQCQFNDKDTLVKALLWSKRLQVLKQLNINDIELKQFIFENTIVQNIELLLNKSNQQSLQQVILEIFNTLIHEVISQYEECILSLPLEYLDHKFLFQYLPLGSLNPKASQFWMQAKEFLSHEKFNQLCFNDSLFNKIAHELIFEVVQPQKAALILREAITQRNQKNLTHIAISAVEHVQVSDLSQDRKQAIEQLFGLDQSLEESIQSLNRYFQEAKWIFVSDRELYKRYLKELKIFIVDIVGIDQSPLLNQILNQHGNQIMIFLKDDDLVTLTVEIIYQNLSTQHIDQVHQYYERLKELSHSKREFMQRYLHNHIHIQKHILNKYRQNLSFKDLLLLQTQQDQPKLIQLCNQIITQKIEHSRKFKQQLLTFSKHTTTGQVDMSWIQILDHLFELCERLGYSNKEIDVNALFIKKLLSHKHTQAVYHLLQTDALPFSELEEGILSYLQEEYNQQDDNSFFQFYSDAKAFIELLIQKQSVPDSKSKKELFLINVTHFLKDNELLSDLPMIQIREDFYNNKLIDRILQVHGFKEYPQQFEILADIQTILQQDQQQVVEKVLKHLNTIKAIQNNPPKSLEKMIQDQVITAKFKNIDQISDILFKIIEKNQEIAFNISLLKYMLETVDRKSHIYAQVCQNLINITKDRQLSIYDRLKNALDDDLIERAKYLIRQIQKDINLEKNQLFLRLIQDCSFNYPQMKKLSQIIDIDENMRSSLKQLSRYKASEIKNALINEQYFLQLTSNEERSQQIPKVEISQNQAQSQEFDQQNIEKLVKSNDLDEIQEILEEKYLNENDELDLQLILSEMNSNNIFKVSQTFFGVAINKIKLPHNFPKQMFIEINQAEPNLNVLLLLADYLNIQIPQSLQAITLLQESLSQRELRIAEEFSRIVSDYNLYTLAFFLDQLNSRYAQLLTLSHYVNKLRTILKHSGAVMNNLNEIEKHLYSVISKDTLLDLIDDESLIQKVNQSFIKELEKIIKDKRSCDDVQNAVLISL